MNEEEKIEAVVELVLLGKTEAEQIKILRNCVRSVLLHPWADGEFVDSALGNIAREYGVAYLAEYNDANTNDEGTRR